MKGKVTLRRLRSHVCLGATRRRFKELFSNMREPSVPPDDAKNLNQERS